MLTEMETFSVTVDREGSVQHGGGAGGWQRERFLGEYGIQEDGSSKGCVRYEGRSG